MSADAWFTWLDGHVEAVEILAERDGSAYVSWPESRRTVKGCDLTPKIRVGTLEVIRPESWVTLDRVTVQCSANVGGDPASGCDELIPYGRDVCADHGALVGA